MLELSKYGDRQLRWQILCVLLLVNRSLLFPCVPTGVQRLSFEAYSLSTNSFSVFENSINENGYKLWVQWDRLV